MFLILAVLAGLSFPAWAEETPRPGFGLQPGIIQPPSDPKTLTKRILSTTRYKLTPGDSYELVITIEETERYPLLLSDDYLLDIPFIGTVNVRGMFFSDLKKMVVKRIKERVPVQFVDFILTSPAFFDVFIYGGVKAPGIATVNPLSRISDAILLAQGLVEGASFRTIELTRKGEKRILDLSRFATQADLSQNPLLQPEDEIYIPQAERIVEVKGKVKFPGFYELLPDETLENLLLYAGGRTPDAETDGINISRVAEGGRIRVTTVSIDEVPEFELENGDVVAIASILENPERITVDAAVYGKPTKGDEAAVIPDRNIVLDLPYVPGMSLLEILVRLGGPTPLADTERAYVQREATGEKIEAEVEKLWETRNRAFDIELEPNDLVVIPMEKLQVFVAGEVNDSGALPYANGYKVYDYILAAGGINADTGDPDGIFFIDEAGNRTRTDMESDVAPGTLIYVGKNSWTLTQKRLTNILVITGFTAAIVGLTQAVVDLIQEFY